MREYFVWLAKLITILLALVVGIPLILGIVAGVAQMVGKGTGLKDTSRTVAVVELTNEITDSKEILEELHHQAESNDVKAIVLRIDSPGGAVGPSQDIYENVKRLKAKKPIVASMGSVAASGGLYAALGASKIFAQSGTLTGSIGVIFQVPNLSKIAERVGVDVVTVKSGKLKDVGNMFREMSPEEQAFLEETVHKVHEVFTGAVVESRNLSKEKVAEFADGRVIVGTDAKALGLIDEFGDVYAAARAALELAGVTLPAGKEPDLIYPGDKYAELRAFLREVSSLPAAFNPLRPKAEIKYLMY